jgi:hypothetical protein
MPYQLIDTVTPDVGAKAGADKINNNAIQAQYQGGYFTVGGTANAITLTSATGAPSGYSTGQEFCFRANATNTGVTTVNVDGLGIKTIKTISGADLPAGYLSTSADTCLRYDGVNMIANVSTGTLADQVPLNSDLGTASTKDTGTATGQIPTADDLGVVGNTNITSANYDYENALGVGVVMILRNNSGSNLLSTATISGANLNIINFDGSGVLLDRGAVGVGTWKNISGQNITNGNSGHFSRIS